MHLWTLRFILLMLMNIIWTPEQPKEYPAYVPLPASKAKKPEVLHGPPGQWTRQYNQGKLAQSDTQRIEAANAEQIRELQRYLDIRKQSGHYEPPERNTGPIHLHAIHLQRISTYEMEAFVVTEKRKVV